MAYDLAEFESKVRRRASRRRLTPEQRKARDLALVAKRAADLKVWRQRKRDEAHELPEAVRGYPYRGFECPAGAFAPLYSAFSEV